jgi:Ca-activated chloride channel family protein
MTDSRRFHEQFLNFLEGTLSEEERRSFNEALQSEENLALEFAQYQQVMQIEREIALQQFDLDEHFTDKIMARLSPKPWSSREVVMSYLSALGRFLSSKLMISVFFLLALAIAWWLRSPVNGGYPQTMAPGPEYTQGQNYIIAGGAQYVPKASYNDTPIAERADIMLTYMNGQFGAMLMILSFLFAVYSVIFRKFKLSGVFVMLTCLTFTLRSLVSTWFNDTTLMQDDLAFFHQQPSSHKVLQPKTESSPPRPYLANPEEYDKFPRIAGNLVKATGSEKYGDFKEGKPILTKHEPRSTFSIDVDTGSYTNARRYLRLGQLPPPQAVRIEEFLNYFDYTYPESTDGSPFAAGFEIAPRIDALGKYLLKIGIKAQESQLSDFEKPRNLVFLVDTSGSMQDGDKLPLVKQSLSLLVEKMRPGDTLSIVTYAGFSQVLLPPTSATEKDEILRRIEELSSGGSTAGAAGILDAYRLAEQTFIRNGVNRVILATDGDFNVGISNTEDLIRLIEEKRKTGITLTTLGFGTGNFNEAMMEQLANKGNGNYYYIDSFNEARKVFEDDLYGTIEVVAKDVKIQIEFNPSKVAQYRLIGYDNRILRNEDFGNDQIDAGEIGAGHTITAMYEIVLVGSKAASNLETAHRYKQQQVTTEEDPTAEFQDELAFLQVRYKQPEGNESIVKNYPILESIILPNLDQASTDFCFASAVEAFAAKLRESQFAPQTTYPEIARIGGRCKGPDTSGRRQEFLKLVEDVSAIVRGR